MRQGNPDDPRSTRTRQMLISTYERQLATGNRTKSVAALTRAAGVSRSAFYCHFEGVEDVAVAALREFLDGFGSEITDGEDPGASNVGANQPDLPAKSADTASIRELVEYIHQHRALCATALVADELPPAYAELRSTLIEHITLAISRVSDGETETNPAHAATFLVGGIMSLLVTWLTHPGETPDEITSTIHTMLPAWLRTAKEFRSPIQIST